MTELLSGAVLKLLLVRTLPYRLHKCATNFTFLIPALLAHSTSSCPNTLSTQGHAMGSESDLYLGCDLTLTTTSGCWHWWFISIWNSKVLKATLPAWAWHCPNMPSTPLQAKGRSSAADFNFGTPKFAQHHQARQSATKLLTMPHGVQRMGEGSEWIQDCKLTRTHKWSRVWWDEWLILGF